MRKSSVYLPDALKAALTERAARTGRSEAEVIRGGPRRGPGDAPRPRHPPPARPDPPVPGRLVGVGVGPGEADLLTGRAVAARYRADRVVAPTTAARRGGPGRGHRAPGGPRDRGSERIAFLPHGPAARAAAIDGRPQPLAGHLDAGEEVAFITLGDPPIYSTVGSVAAGCRPAPGHA